MVFSEKLGGGKSYLFATIDLVDRINSQVAILDRVSGTITL